MLRRLPLLLLLPVAIAFAGSGFDFVVLGDRTAGAREDVFESILSEVKLLQPELLMNVGDLVEGYTKSRDTLEQQWDTIIRLLRNTGVYYRLTPGNHDITDAMSETVFVRHFGSPYYSFNYGGSHFLVIDNSRWDSAGALPEAEFAWIDRDLALNRLVRWTFVFMHRSWWTRDLRQGKADRLHRIFKQYGVDYVFSGHDHYYCSAVLDSVHYIQVGPSGSRYKEYDDEERGAFQNYLLVHAGDSAVRVEVFKPGNLRPPDCVTIQDIALLDSSDRYGTVLPKLTIVPETQLDDSLAVGIRNVTGTILSTRCTWNLEESDWRIEPETLVVVCNPLVSTSNLFRVRLGANASPYPLPRLNLTYPYARGKQHLVNRFLPIRRVADCPRIPAPKLDGILNDKAWKKVKPVRWFGSKDGGPSPAEPFTVLLGHDDSLLYVAARCTETRMGQLKADETARDGRVADDDNINILLCPNPDSGVYYQLIINPAGTIWDRKCWTQDGRSVRDNGWNANWQVANSLDKDSWVLELAVPLNDLGFRVSNSGLASMGFNLARYQSRLKAVGIYQVPFVHDVREFADLRMQ
jgi:hypothetical protein